MIVVLSSADYEWALHGSDQKIQIPMGVAPVPVGEYVDIDNPILAGLDDQGLLTPGSILIQSPFSANTYERDEQAVVGFHTVKLSLVSELCQILGATAVTSRVETFRIDTSKRSGEAHGGRPFVKGEATLEYIASDEAKLNLRLQDTFDGGAADTARASAFLREHGISDQDLVSLVGMRGRTNPIKQRSITVSYSRKGDRNIELSTRLEIPAAQIGAKYRAQREFIESFSQELEIRFEN